MKITKEHLKMAERDGCKTVGEFASWYQGYIQGRIDAIQDEIDNIKKGEYNDTDTN